MSKSYNEKIKDILSEIKIKHNLKQKDVAKKIKLNATYFSRKKDEKANKEIYQRILIAFPEFQGKEISTKVDLDKPDRIDQARLAALEQNYLRFKSQLTNTPIEELLDQLDDETRLILRYLKP